MVMVMLLYDLWLREGEKWGERGRRRRRRERNE
jgi:hypothetical protein